MKTIAYALVEGVCINVHNHVPPSDEEWSVYMEFRRQHQPEIRGILVLSEGGRPSAKQREQLRDVLAEGPVPKVAIITQSQLVRNTAGLLTWFFKDKVRILLPRELGKAFELLGVAPGQAERVHATIASLQAEIHGVPVSKAGA
jgi:hypothetical protein